MSRVRSASDAKPVVSGLVTAILFASLLFAKPVFAQSTVIDFDDQRAEQPISDQYQNMGVLFPSNPVIMVPLVKTRSGSQMLVSAALSEGFDPGPLPILFITPQSQVKLFAGLVKRPFSETTAILRAYDRQQGGSIVAQMGPINLGSGPADVMTAFEVKTRSASIYRVEIEYSGNGFEAIDDLTYDRAGSRPDRDSTPPVVKIIAPAEERTFNADEFQVPLDFLVTEDSFLRRVRVTVIGSATQTGFDICGNRAGSCASRSLDDAWHVDVPVFQGANRVMVTVEDFAGNTAFGVRNVRIGTGFVLKADLLIVTPQMFEAALQPLVDHKNNTGMPTQLVTLESIYGTYTEGRDPQEKIKLAIAAAEKGLGIKYVMLIGDVDQFPVRYGRHEDKITWGNGFAPTDLYYADLYDENGNFDDWDYDNDNLFGEMNSGDPSSWNDLNRDRINLDPDVAVGRVPASNVTEVQTYVKKVITYEQGIPSGAIYHIPEMMLVTGGPGLNSDGTAELIANEMAKLSYKAVKHYWTVDWQAIPDTDPQWAIKRVDLINQGMDKGVGFVAYVGHGFGGDAGSVGGNAGGWYGWYGYGDIARLNNSSALPIIFASACETAMFHFPHWPYQTKSGSQYVPLTGIPPNQQDAPEPAAVQPSKYDLDTLAEHFLVKHPVGGIAYFGGYTGLQQPGDWLLQRLFEEFVASGGTTTLGDMWAGGVKRYLLTDFPKINQNWGNWYAAAIYHHIQKMMLFGDPSLRINYDYFIPDICDIYPQFCRGMTVPEWCLGCKVLRPLDQGLPIRFLDRGDRYFASVDGINETFGPVDVEMRSPRGLEILVETAGRAGLSVAIYDDTGTLIVEDATAQASKTLQLRPERGRNYMVVLGPGPETELGDLVDVRLHARNPVGE